MLLIKENVDPDMSEKLIETIYYIINDQKIIGTIQLYSDISNSKYRYIKLFIFKPYRNKGYGINAMNNLFSTLLKDDNLDKLIYLSSSKRIEKFLNKCGFIENTEYLYDRYYYEKILHNNNIREKII